MSEQEAFPYELVFKSYHLGLNSSPKTLKAYLPDVRLFFAGFKGDPFKATRHDINAFMTTVRESGAATKTILRKLSSVSSYFAALMDDELMNYNPCDAVRRPKTQKTVPKFLQPDDVQRILSFHPTNERLTRAMVVFKVFYGCGVRLSEMAGMNVGDIMLHEGRAKVLGKGNKERMVGLPLQVCQVLTAWTAGRDAAAPLFVADASNQHRVRGERAGISCLRADVKALAKAAGVTSRIWPHLLRSTFAQTMLDDGAELSDIQSQLGHESPATTQLYAKTSIDRVKKSNNAHHPLSKEDKKDA